jgi:hypothetical protein
MFKADSSSSLPHCPRCGRRRLNRVNKMPAGSTRNSAAVNGRSGGSNCVVTI